VELHDILVQNHTSIAPVEYEQPSEQHSGLGDDNEGRSPSNPGPEAMGNIRVLNDTSTNPVEGEQPFEQHSNLGDDNEGRPPSNPGPEAMVVTALPRRPNSRRRRSDRRRLRSNGRTLEPPERVTSRRFMDVEPTMEAGNLDMQEHANDIADGTTPPVSCSTIATTTSPLVHEEIPPADHVQAKTLEGLRHRKRTLQKASDPLLPEVEPERSSGKITALDFPGLFHPLEERIPAGGFCFPDRYMNRYEQYFAGRYWTERY
jgi:hypothetical protein